MKLILKKESSKLSNNIKSLKLLGLKSIIVENKNDIRVFLKKSNL